jgi:hypothetical protein
MFCGVCDSIPLHPEVLWAQRQDVLYVTIQLSDLAEEKINLSETTLKFEATNGEGKPYAVDLEFYHEVDPEVSGMVLYKSAVPQTLTRSVQKSKQAKTGRSFAFIIQKKEAGDYWPRLLKNSQKPHWLKTDFAKWKEEDEVEEDVNTDNPFGNNMDFGAMGGMGGMEGMPGMGGMGGMPGMGGMGGMPGMGGMGGMPGMGGMGGMPGMEDFDFSKSCHRWRFLHLGHAGF